MFDTKCLPSLAAFATRPDRGLEALPLVARYPAGEKTKGIRVACSTAHISPYFQQAALPLISLLRSYLFIIQL